MKRWSKCKLLFKSAYNKSKRGIKGSISLFLALIVTPLLGLTCLLVESIRYQDVIEEINEISDLSSLSTLANYDKFLKDRFALLAVSQETEVNALYDNYFAKNSQLIANDFTLASTDVEGAYALAEIQIMRQQILEYCEISSAVEIAFKGLGLDDLFEQLEEILNLDKIKNFSDGLSASADIAQSVADLIDAIKEIVEMTGSDGSYTKAVEAYEEAYGDFSTDLEGYISALNDCDADDIYNDSSVVSAWNTLTEDGIIDKSSRTDYKDACGDLAEQVESLRSKVTTVSGTANDILSSVGELRDATREDGAASTNFDIVLDIAEALKPFTDFVRDSAFADTTNQTVQDLNEAKRDVNNIVMATYNHSSTATNAADQYYVEIPDALDTLGSTITNVYNNLESYAEGDAGTNSFSDGLVNIVSSICDLKGAVDPNLNAIVVDPLNPLDFGANDFSNCVGTAAIVGFLDAIERFTHPDNIFDLLIGLVELIGSIVALIVAITSWATVFIYNIVRIISDGIDGELGNNFLMCGYAVYNFPNRTNYNKDDAITFTGYDFYNEMYRGVMGGSASPMDPESKIDELSSLLGEAVRGEPGTDPTFKGAEVEYLLCGYSNEKLNQAGAFYNLLMLRMLLDFIPILLDSEVKEEASAAGPYAWIIYILIIIVEPLFDTFILVNGGDQYLYKHFIYLTPSGVEKLVEDVIAVCGAASAIKDLADDAKSLSTGEGSPSSDYEFEGLFKCSYTEHMWLLLFLSTDADSLMDRVQNLVCYESTAYYQYHAEEFDFNKTYTYVHSTVNYNINPMFDFSSMTETGIIDQTIKSDRYTGY